MKQKDEKRDPKVLLQEELENITGGKRPPKDTPFWYPKGEPAECLQALFFPLLSPVALAAVLQFRNPSAKASGTGTSPLFQPEQAWGREVDTNICIFNVKTEKSEKKFGR